MQFVHPEFLWALPALAIPVIIHLLQLRRLKVVYFPRTDLLQSIELQKRNRRNLRHWLVLTARLLFFAFLILAFAQPYQPKQNTTNSQQPRSISLYIDNTFSMNAENADGSMLELAKKKAIELVKELKESDQIQILTADLKGNQSYFLTRDDAVNAIAEIQPTERSPSFRQLAARQLAALASQPGRQHLRFIFSDFQDRNDSRVTDFDFSDTTCNTYLVPFSTNRLADIGIDSCWLTTPVLIPGQKNTIKIRVFNHSDEAQDQVSVSLQLNGQQKGVTSASIPAQSSVDVEIPFQIQESAWQQGMVSVVDQPITFNDRFYFAIKPLSKPHLLELYGHDPSKYLKAACSDDAFFQYQSMPEGSMQSSGLESKACIYLNELTRIDDGLLNALGTFVKAGGTVMVIPEADDSPVPGNLVKFLGIQWGPMKSGNFRIGRVNTQTAYFRDVFEQLSEQTDLPLVSRYFPLRSQGIKGIEPLLTLENGDPFIGRLVDGRGQWIISASSWRSDWTNLGNHALFVPLVIQPALNRPGDAMPLFFRTQGDALLPIPEEINAREQTQWSMTTGKRSFTPSVLRKQNQCFADPGDQLTEAGWYTLKKDQDVLATYAFNFPGNESRASFLKMDAFSSFKNVHVLDKPHTSLQQQWEGSGFDSFGWKTLIILATLLIFTEIALIRWMK